MSNRREFIKFLKENQYSSVSNINLKYNKVFKEFSLETLVERSKFVNSLQKKWIIEEEKKAKSKFITTNDKLKQIINSHRNLYKIQETFFKTFDKEPLFKKLLNTKERLLKTKTNKSSEKLNSLMKIKQNLREKDDSFYKRKYEENNRKPPLGLYNPKYDCIQKHIPSVNFHIVPSSTKRTISYQNNQDNKKEIKKKKNSRNFKLINTTLSNSLTPITKLKKNYIFSPSIDANREKEKMNKYKMKIFSLNTNKTNENLFLSQLNLVSSETNNNDNNENVEKIIPLDYNPKIVEKNIPVPIFSKMSQRFKYNIKSNFNPNLDYTPNYNAIFSNVVDIKPIDYEKRRKYNYLKKIITNYNQNTDYELFPELNIKNIK